MELADDIKKTEIKRINKAKWRFDFRENGYVIVSAYMSGKGEGKNGKDCKSHWQKYLHAVDLDACLSYVYIVNGGKGKPYNYDELEDA